MAQGTHVTRGTMGAGAGPSHIATQDGTGPVACKHRVPEGPERQHRMPGATKAGKHRFDMG
eukprot:jgi/Mesvir1/4027/Mv26277-RA.1